MSNEELKKEYPIQDDIWASRRWNKEMTDYVDLSGHEDYVDRVKATDVNYKGQILCKQKGCPSNANEFSDYWKERYMQLRNIIIGDSTHMIGKVRDRYKELERKEYDWKSFYNGWLEGRSDFFQKVIQFEALIEIMQTDEEAGLYDDKPEEK